MDDLSPLANMAEIFSAVVVVGGIIILWKKLSLWTEDLRKEVDSPIAFEWFQWLTITLERLQDDSDLPAYEAHTKWQPSNLSNEI